MFSYQCIDNSEMADPAHASLAHSDLTPTHPISREHSLYRVCVCVCWCQGLDTKGLVLRRSLFFSLFLLSFTLYNLSFIRLFLCCSGAE